MSEEAAVLVGNKPLMNYVTACVYLLNRGNNEVKIRAMGANISKAVDVVNFIRRKLGINAKVEEIVIDAESVRDGRGVEKLISTIEIKLVKPSA